MRKGVLLAASALALHATGALARDASTAGPPDAQPGTSGGQTRTDAAPAATAAPSSDVVVTARRLDEARASIQPSLGATSYTITNETIQALPGGDNQQFNQIIQQLPGVVQDSYGQFHVRDDHNNLQYRINGTVLPEGIAVFGQTLSPRLVDRFSLLTGALPAQYGLRTAGIIDITTKSGFANGGTASIYGGSHGMIEPSIEYGGSSGNTNYFVSGDYRHDDLGIESVDGSSNPLHDRTDQFQGFAYVDHIVDEHDRVSFVGGFSNQYFQIPDPRGLNAAVDGVQAQNGLAPFSVGGVTSYPSEALNERQLERTGFGQLAFLHDAGPLTVQTSIFARASTLQYRPDMVGELLFNGQAQQAFKKDFTAGFQVDASFRADDANTIRGGVLVTRDRGTSRTNTFVFPVDANGNQAGAPVGIVDNGAQTEWTESVYAQDELKLSRVLTFNFGGRFDNYCGYRCEDQFSPRANLVYQAHGTTVHVGYARYFSPPPFELVATTTVGLFQGTSAAAPTTLDTTPYAERQNYVDVGAQQKIGRFTVGVDGYTRYSTNLIDEGQFGAPIVLTPFNYAKGRIHGFEFNASYAAGGLLAYANFAYAKAQGRDIISSQFDFDPGDLAYIQNHYIYLDHDQTYTASGGFSYGFRHGPLTGLKLGADALFGSGLRADGAVPNGDALPDYATVNLSASYHLAHPGVGIRFDVINVGDHEYEIRDGTGVGVGAPQYGARRGFFVGLTKDL